MALIDNVSLSGSGTVYDFKKEKEYTLEDLRNDDEFVKRTERFLESVGEGDNVTDLYQYFRGTDFNLKDTFKVASQAKTFTDEQKKDYTYLKNKFDNANVGGLREKTQLGIDATQEILSDPVNWASALLIPWTGGTSMLGRVAGGEAAKQALKEATKVGLRQSLGKVVLNAPGQVLKGPLSTKQILSIASAEGMLYGGTHNYVNQSIDLNVGRRDSRSYLETATTGAIGAVAAPAVIAGFKGAGQIPKWVNTVNEQRIARIDHNDNYKSTFVETTAGKLVEGTKTVGDVLKLTTLPLRPTTFLRKKAKDNPLLQELLKLFRYDAMEGFVAPTVGKQEVLKIDYDTAMRKLWGQKTEKLTKILRDNKLYTSQNRFTSQERKNWVMTPGLSDDVNNDLSYFIRSGKSFKMVGKNKVKLADNIIKAGREIRKELDDVFNKAERAGLNPNRADNYFPRGWRIDVIKNNKKEFVEKIMKAEGASRDSAEDLWLKLTTEGTPESGTVSGLRTRLQSERLLNKLDDAEFSKFLNNDVEGVLKQYYTESAALITRSKLFGETEADFIAKWLDPIKKSGLDLNGKEELYLKTLYNITTGQQGRINRNRRDFFNLIPTGKIGAGIHDVLTVTMQTSMLGLSTLTSFAEIGVPLLLGTESKIGGKAIGNAIVDSGKEWWGKQKQNFGVGDANIDIRSASRQDLNAFMSSVNLAAEDRAVAIYGQAVGKTATKIQNFFFKSIGLHDWTRFVQLVGYDSGKNLIYKNLRTIADNPTMNKTNKKRLTDELAELGIDVQNGLNWLDRGGLHTDRFFMQDVRAAANRYTNEVVMNPTAASAQKPLIHSLATTRWIYGLMGFPTAFANGPLRKTVRNFTRDAKTFSSGGTRLSSARAVTGATFMASVGLLNYTLRTGGKNFEQLENGEITEYDLLERSLQYSGLLGPAEYYVRYSKAARYESKISAAIGSVVGPNLPDVYDYIKGFFDRGVVAETAYKRSPFIISLKSLHPEAYKKGLEYARELDKQSPLKPEGVEKKEGEVITSGKKFFSKGGIVEGEDNVPFTKENPADRINPYTGEPYQEQMSRLGFSVGGVLARQLFKPKLNSKQLTAELSPTKTFDEAIDLGRGEIGYSYTDTNKNISVTLKDARTEDYISPYTINDVELAPDIELDFIGNISKNKSKGLASKELDKILKEVDSRDMSMTLSVDSAIATKNTKLKGLSDKDLKKWYERKGFIFDEDSLVGYRPAKSEDKTLLKAKVKKITKKEGEEIEKYFNKDFFEIQDSFISDPMTLKELFDQGKLKRGYLTDGGNDIFYFDGKNKPFKISNASLEYSYQTDKYKVVLKNNKTEQSRQGLQEGGPVLPVLTFADGNSRKLTSKEFDNMVAINEYLKGKGYRKEARAGILGNIHIETGGSFSSNQIENAQDKKLGYGIFQLTNKKKDYDKWMSERGFEEDKINNMAAQLEYMHDTIQTGREIGGGNANTLQKSFNEKSAEDIALDFSNIWEKPGVPHNEQRVKATSTIFNFLD